MIKRRIILCMMMLLCAMVMVAISPMLEQFQIEYGLSLSQQGVLMAIQFWGFTIFTILGGVGADSITKKTILCFAMLIVGAALIMISVWESFTFLLIALFFVGGGLGIMESQTVSMMSDTAENNKTFYINFIQIFFGVGALIFPVLFSVFLYNHLSWKILYCVLGIVYLFVLIFFFLTPYEEICDRSGLDFKIFKTILDSKGFIAVCVCIFCYTGAEAGVWGWITSYTKNVMLFSTTASNLCVGIFWTMMIIGRLMAGIVSQRIRIRTILVLFSVSAALVTLLIAFVSSNLLVWITIIFMGLTYSAQWPTLVAFGSKLHKHNQSVVIAILTASGGVGMTVVPYLMGIIAQYINERISMLLPVFLLAVIPGIVIAVSKKEEEVI